MKTEGEVADVIYPVETRRILEYIVVVKGHYHQKGFDLTSRSARKSLHQRETWQWGNHNDTLLGYLGRSLGVSELV